MIECQSMNSRSRIENKIFVAPSKLCSSTAGLCTSEWFAQGHCILDYSGKLKTSECPSHFFYSQKLNEFTSRLYGFSIDDQREVDSTDVGNLMRFANHAHQAHANPDVPVRPQNHISHNPEDEADPGEDASLNPNMTNCQTIIVFNGYENTAFLVASRNIEPGEELVFDYNYDKEFDWLSAYSKKYLVK